LIDKARKGDILTATGAATGVFTLPDNPGSYTAAWFFAAGIGITPIFPIIRALLHHSHLRAVLVYSNRNREETVFYKALRELETTFGDRLKIVWLHSTDKDVRLARFSKESFPTIRQRHLTEPPGSILAYVCGPTDYMWLVQLLLQDAGVPKEHVRREVFQFDRDVPRALPPDVLPHKVTIHNAAGTFSFINTYPQSILASARAAGITLPFSCESGQCGSCTALCTKGKVWMSYNEVLTDNDIRDGRILTCTGHAIEGDLTLKL
jgi:ring-1,2-phenylacetyl-CoA epoxidase subunit PaaE